MESDKRDGIDESDGITLEKWIELMNAADSLDQYAKNEKED